jgi:hypothetical protein
MEARPGLAATLPPSESLVTEDPSPYESAKAVKYYDLNKNWSKRIRPHLGDPLLNEVLVRDLNKYTTGLWGTPFTAGMYPEDVENVDWRWRHRGREPRFWKYVKHGACHWTCNFSLRLAMLSEPGRPWRIITSEEHSTVWDGQETLFEFALLALGVDAGEAFQLAQKGGIELPVGEFHKPGFPPHYSQAYGRGEKCGATSVSAGS